MTSFNNVSWSDDEDIDVVKMNEMASNDRWLYDHMARGYYHAWGIRKNDGIKFACGIVPMGPDKNRSIDKVITFGNFFDSTCRPVVVASHSSYGRATINIGGVAAGNHHPDATGFRVTVTGNPINKTTNYFPTQFYVHWVAMGW